MSETDRFLEMVASSNSIVFFGGAGVSTESGIPDYRSKDGLYNQKYNYPPETMLSHEFFMSHTEEFFDFYRDKLVHPEAKPNITHIKLADLEKAGKVSAVVTQNVDGLHQMAGSAKVDELHGSVHRNYCMDCHAFYDSQYILTAGRIPRCEKCGGIVKPDVVLYGEGLDNGVISSAINHIAGADMLIVGGTSLAVYPAASFINYFTGPRLAIINKTPLSTALGSSAVVIEGALGEVFSQVAL